MRLRPEARRQDQYVVWMNRDEYRQYRAAAPDAEHRLAVRLIGESGLRIKQVNEVNVGEIEQINGEYFAKVTNYDSPRGAEFRDAYIPSGLYDEILEFQSENGIPDDKPLIDYTTRTVQVRITNTSEAAVEATGDDRYDYVTAKDLRRYFAVKLLQEDRLQLRVVVELGGWNNIESLGNYVPYPMREQVFEEIDRYEEVTDDEG